MRNLLQNLLILIALGLCGLCTWQWYQQVQDHDASTKLRQAIYDQSAAIAGYTNSISTLDTQVAQMDARITELRETVKSNLVELATLRQEKENLTSLVAQYKNATETYQEQIKMANEAIRRQNESVKAVVAERDEFVKRLNDSIKERNEVVNQFNDLVKRYEELQAAYAKLAPPEKPKEPKK